MWRCLIRIDFSTCPWFNRIKLVAQQGQFPLYPLYGDFLAAHRVVQFLDGFPGA